MRAPIHFLEARGAVERNHTLLARLILGAIGLAMMVAPAACSTSESLECPAAKGKETVSVCVSAGGAACPAAGTKSAANLVADAVTEEVPSCSDQASDCSCDIVVEKVLCGPDLQEGKCCYVVEYYEDAWCEGRPFTVLGGARVAPLAGGPGWSAEVSPTVSSLDQATRAALSAEWARDALFEHASVASFARFALEAMAVGAPASLVRAAHEAMGDEIRHAEICFGLASALGGERVAPGPLPIEGALERRDLKAITVAVVHEGCVGETVSALIALAARDAATDPAVRAALDEIAADEASHAALSWRWVGWALEQGGAELRDAVEAAFAEATAVCAAGDHAAERGAGIDPSVLHTFGRLTAAEQRAVAARGLAEVVRPCARTLLSRPAAGAGDWQSAQA